VSDDTEGLPTLQRDGAGCATITLNRPSHLNRLHREDLQALLSMFDELAQDVSLHALVLLSAVTTLVELDLARADARATLGRTLAATLRNTVVHPVVLPVVAGLAFNAAGLPLPAFVDETLQLLAAAVVPLCLVLIGVSLATHGLAGGWRGALPVMAAKLLLLPAAVLALAHWGFGLAGRPLAVVVMLAALPVGSNALIFAQRYHTLEAETTGATVRSTLAFLATAPLWLALLSLL